MINTILEAIRYTLTLLFGIFVSTLFLDIKINKKNILIIFGFFYIDLALQAIFYFSKNISSVISLYPLITHLPLFLFFIFIFKKRIFPTLIAIASAYLYCQISNWSTIFVSSFINGTADIIYSLSLFLSFGFIVKFVYLPISQLLKKQSSELISFGIIPIFYYIFDYVSTVYTQLLYVGNRITVEFTPFLLCICYFVFCTVYFKQYEEKQHIETNNKLMYMKQTQVEKEMTLMEENEKKIVLIRHDMRHFLNNILNDLENNQNEHAIDYIHTLFDSLDQTVRKQYCLNNTINMIIASYENRIQEGNIDFHYQLSVPKKLAISDIDLTSILSNALENALKAVLLLKDYRFIQLTIEEKCGKLLISVENNYLNEPIFVDGIPISKEKNHGFGSQSIVYTVDKLNGNCQFSVNNHRFILRIVI
ncbi:ATP-binding protein [Faecalibacillus faecis]|uniref:ATP-binding protein n=1 Tax=Faecalibacillus faecis TaxID=1982628 RepID=A0AAW4VVT8_9FIRM|nr:ATP-binding protein [Faecalibacillus faecis]MCB8568772.1 ATP-binding protein [Faecalibacillus faecis]MCB8610824.1 ATP-binding protein [Faecalibacillus faecis]MCQ5200688.1 ATP-binding protein [Faecalibacillus faecis]